jgi:metallo-beta-lactamase family protein
LFYKFVQVKKIVMKIQFLGAVHEVTGSKHLISTKSGKKLLLDCGLYQGKGLETDAMNRDIGVDPREIDYILLSHAHIDHSGCIPYLYKNGFRGTVVCHHATRDLCSILLPDCGHIQVNDNKTFNKKRAKQGLPPVEPLYTRDEAVASMDTFISIPYNKPFFVDEGIKLTLTDSGHMLGSAVLNLEITEKGQRHRIAYTGDVGRPVNRILRSPQPFPQADILITECTYGSRLHEQYESADAKLLEIVEDTCVKKKGKLIIPSFSVGRTQEIVYTLNNLYNEGKLPRINVYVDSPLSVNATNIMRLHPECYNANILEVMEKDPDPFGFNGLTYVHDVVDSKKLNASEEPCIIISASGMMEAGRVKHHLANSISNPKNTILVVGYCSPVTLGAKIRRGDKQVSIFGTMYDVKADVRVLESYSGHGDYKEMIEFIKCQDPVKLKKIYLVHGDLEAAEAYQQHLSDAYFYNIEIPTKGQEVKA